MRVSSIHTSGSRQVNLLFSCVNKLMEDFLTGFDRDTFDFFRELYNRQLNILDDCDVAYRKASVCFHKKYGYVPFRSLDHFLEVWFRQLNGFQLFN
jgi:hypothetical protein